MYQEHYDFVVNKREQKTDFEDIYDGRYYRKVISSLPNNDYVTLNLNTDGAQPFESSTSSVWPIYLCINKLPLEKRFKSLITCGIWFGQSHPNMQLFLLEFVKMINEINKKGILCLVKGEKRLLKLYIINCTVDSPARAEMFNRMSFNAYYGCHWCFVMGKYFAKAMRYPIEVINPRNHKNTIKCMKLAELNGNSVFGVKGPTSLSLLEKFDVIESFNPDYMHCVLIGAAKQVNKYIMQIINKKDRQLLDKYLENIKVPNKLSKLTRPLSECSKWKARDWENYILYYSIPLFEIINLPKKNLAHWGLLVDSLHILLSSKISYQIRLYVSLS